MNKYFQSLELKIWAIRFIFFTAILSVILAFQFLDEEILPSGFSGKTSWDIVDVFLFPIILLAGGVYWDKKNRDREKKEEISQKKREDEQRAHQLERDENLRREQEIRDDEARSMEIYTGFVDRITTLIVDRDIFNKSKESENQELLTLTKTRIWSAMRTLNHRWRSELIEFLSELGLLVDTDLLQGNSFDGMELRKVDFSSSTLTECSFEQSNLFRANFSEATCDFSNFKDAKLRTAKLKNASLFKCDFSGVDTDLKHADLTNARVGLALFDGAYMGDVKFHNNEIWDTSFRKCDLSGSNFSNVLVRNSSFEGADLSSCVFQRVKFLRVDFSDVILNDAVFKQCGFYQCVGLESQDIKNDIEPGFSDFYPNPAIELSNYLKKRFRSAGKLEEEIYGEVFFDGIYLLLKGKQMPSGDIVRELHDSYFSSLAKNRVHIFVRILAQTNVLLRGNENGEYYLNPLYSDMRNIWLQFDLFINLICKAYSLDLDQYPIELAHDVSALDSLPDIPYRQNIKFGFNDCKLYKDVPSFLNACGNNKNVEMFFNDISRMSGVSPLLAIRNNIKLIDMYESLSNLEAYDLKVIKSSVVNVSGLDSLEELLVVESFVELLFWSGAFKVNPYKLNPMYESFEDLTMQVDLLLLTTARKNGVSDTLCRKVFSWDQSYVERLVDLPANPFRSDFIAEGCEAYF